VNATFLINSAKSDFSFIEDFDLSTIQPVLDEFALEIGLRAEDILDIEVIGLEDQDPGIQIPEKRLKMLSPVDRMLLNVAFEKKNVLLVSDDKQVLNVSRQNDIRCASTPQFIAYLVKQSKVDRNDAIEYLKKLLTIHIRKKNVESVIKRLEKWK
jgi:hypothetical protein